MSSAVAAPSSATVPPGRSTADPAAVLATAAAVAGVSATDTAPLTAAAAVVLPSPDNTNQEKENAALSDADNANAVVAVADLRRHSNHTIVSEDSERGVVAGSGCIGADDTHNDNNDNNDDNDNAKFQVGTKVKRVSFPFRKGGFTMRPCCASSHCYRIESY